MVSSQERTGTQPPPDADDPSGGVAPPGEDEPPAKDEPQSRDLTVGFTYVMYVAAAVALLGPLWRDPANRVLADNYKDQVFFEWVLTHAADALTHFDDPLFTDKINAPYGLNLMANTSILALALPFAPVTLLAGPHVTFVLVTTLALAGTAIAWHFVLNKLLGNRLAAAVGGAFCGFAPAMISQATGHPNIAGQYILPLIVLTVLSLRTPGRPVRRGLVLAALVVVQAFINEELLFLTALALGIFIGCYAVARPREVAQRVPEALKTLGTTALAAGAVLAYPLARQFFGPGHYRGLPEFVLVYGADLAGYWSFARRSLAGSAEAVADLSQGPTEENTFFGWPLLIVLVAIIFWLRSDPVVWALTSTALVFAAMSLGPTIHLHGRDTGIAGPWSWIDQWPLFDSVVPTRLSLAVTPLIGCLLARYVARLDKVAAGNTLLRWQGIGAVVLVLAPLVPTALPVVERPFVPRFFTAGTYRAHIPAGGVVFAVPPGWETSQHVMQWQTAAHQDFAVFGGYFLAPDPDDPTRRAMYGPRYSATAVLLDQVAQSGEVPPITDLERTQATEDLRFMKATTIVMVAHYPRANEVHATVDQLVGPGVLVDGVWVWRVPPT